MKKIIVAIMAVVAIFLVVPKFFAKPINQHIVNLVEQLDNTPGYQVSIAKHHRGWFSSTAIVTIKIDSDVFISPTADQSEYADILKKLSGDGTLNIQHGPILIADGLSLGVAAWTFNSDESLLREALTYSNVERFYSLKGVTDFSGNSRYTDAITAFTTVKNVNNTFSGWAGQGTFSQKSLTYSGSSEFFTLNDKTDVTVKDIKLKIQADSGWLEMLENPIYNSTGKLSVDTINIKVQDESPITMNGLAIAYETEKNTEETLVSMDMSYKVDTVKFSGGEANSFILKIQMNNLEKEFLKAYQNVMQDPNGLDKGLESLMQDNLFAQLQASPEMNISELSMNINDKRFSGNLFTKLDGVQSLPSNLTDPKFWMSHVIARSDITIEKSLALLLGESILLPQLANNPATQDLPLAQQKEMVAAQINSIVGSLVAQGTLTETENTYESALRLDKGAATINNKVTPLPF